MEIRNQELAAGLDQKDIDVATFLGSSICTVDRVVFGEKAIKTPVQIGTIKNNFDDNATYFPPTPERDEQYWVWTPGIKKKFDGQLEAHNIFTTAFFGKRVGLQSACIAIACHEVRHRVQQHRLQGVNFFKNEAQKSQNQLLNRILDFVWRRMRIHKKILYDKKEKRAVIDYRVGDMEFDAQVVEFLLLAQWVSTAIAHSEDTEEFETFLRQVVLVQ